MNKTSDIKILPEDRINLTNDQKNLIALALEKQVPPEDAAYIQKLKDNAKNNQREGVYDMFAELSGYYTKKYGLDFGMIYLSAITGGEEKCKEAIESIEKMKATERTKKENIN
jgi:hypothetical protein